MGRTDPNGRAAAPSACATPLRAAHTRMSAAASASAPWEAAGADPKRCSWRRGRLKEAGRSKSSLFLAAGPLGGGAQGEEGGRELEAAGGTRPSWMAWLLAAKKK